MGTICRATLGVIVLAWLVPPASSQDRLKTMPGYKRYADMLRKTPRAFTSGALSVRWQDDGKSFEYTRSGKRYRYDVTTRKATIVPRKKTKAPKGKRPSRPTRSYVPRGRQAKFAVSPDTRWRAFYKDANLWLRPEKGEGKAIPITTKGNATKRLKFGTASWVYGEELYQKTAMWWSPDSKKIAFYRIDQSKVRDSYLTLNQRQFRNTLSVEAYPKPGEPNPILDIFVYDLDTKKTIQLDVRNGKPFTDDVVGHYVYAVKWTPDGKELLFHRTNRWQNILEICAANPKSGKCRVVVREEWLPSWTENRPQLRFLEDGKKFILASDRTGWRNYYLYDLSGKLKCPITRHKFDVSRITRIDEKNGFLYYLARSGDNHMKLQLHRVKLDGTEDQRLTHPAYNHRVTISPDGKSIVDVAETHNHPPETKLLDATGKVLDVIATSDVTRFEQLGLNKTELFQFTAADGKTVLHGILHKPSQFDPKKKYPLLVGVYAGPETNAARERFLTPSPLTELGFLVARFDSRSVGGRGKRVVDAIYQKLGTVEVDDQAEGVKYLRQRSYVDGDRVGIYGTSYGGYASVMCLLRHPDVFHAACASSSVTDWRHYDKIYTERYMRTPQVNQSGYKAGSAMTYVKNLKGRLMIYYGTADNNVFPSNSLQLIRALQKVGKSFDVQVGPDRGHSGISTSRMMEFFIENLVLNQNPKTSNPKTSNSKKPTQQ